MSKKMKFVINVKPNKKKKNKENIELTKILRKPPPNFQHYVKKMEAETKKWFSYKKTCSLFPHLEYQAKAYVFVPYNYLKQITMI